MNCDDISENSSNNGCRHGLATRMAYCAFALIATNAQAQETQGKVSIEEIVVTAQKREQSLFEVPVSITAFSADMIDRQNIENIQDYVARTPNLVVDQVGVTGQRGAKTVTFRGVTGRANYYIDETPVPTTDVRLFDIERVEILRGPQGTLYGDAAMGGTIKVITNKPSMDAFDALVSTGWSATKDGSDGLVGEAMLNVPLGDKVAFRIAGYTEQIAGYIDNVRPALGRGDQTGGGLLPFSPDVQKDVNDAVRNGGRATLSYAATDSFSIELSAWLQHTETGFFSKYAQATPLQTSVRGRTAENQDLELYNATFQWDLGSVGIVSTTTVWDISTYNVEDFTSLWAGFIGVPVSIFSNPLQLNNDFPANGTSHETRINFDTEMGGLPLFITGGFYYSDSESSRNQVWFDAQSINDVNNFFDPTGALGFDHGEGYDALGVERGLLAYQELPETVEQVAVFTDVIINPFPWLELFGGARYFDFTVSETRLTDGFLFQGLTESSGSTKVDGINVRFGAKADLGERTMAFATVSEGFNIGSALGSALPPPCQPVLDRLGLEEGPVDPESLWSYEVGLRKQMLDGRLQLGGSLFYIDWTDIQETVSLGASDEGCTESLSGNFGSAKIYGSEINASWRLGSDVELGVSLGFNDADRSRPAIGVNAAEQVGQRQISASVYGDYSFSVFDSLEGYIGGDVSYIEEGKEDVPGTPHYSVANLRAALLPTDRLEIRLYARNVFNERPELVFSRVGRASGQPESSTLFPRTIGLEMRMNF